MVAGRTQQYPRPASAKHSTLWRCLRPESADFSQFICHRNWQLQRLKRGRGNHQYKHASLDLKVKPGSFVAINYVAKMLCLQPRYPVAEVMVEIIARNHSPIFCIQSERFESQASHHGRCKSSIFLFETGSKRIRTQLSVDHTQGLLAKPRHLPENL